MAERDGIRNEMAEEAAGYREAKYGNRGKTAKNDPACVRNDAEFSGKIVDVYRQKTRDGSITRFAITCGYPGMKKDDKGRFIRDRITVRFFGADGDYYAAKYKKGDFVIAKAVVQTRTDRHTGRRTTEFWGQSLDDVKKNVLSKDYNKVWLTGRIVNAVKESDKWISLLVMTQIWKTHFNSMTEKNDSEDLYRSITRVRVYTGYTNAADIADFRLTKGTVVAIEGRVYGRTEKERNGKGIRRIESVIADDIRVVGDIQKPQKDPITTVRHDENSESWRKAHGMEPAAPQAENNEAAAE